MTNGEKLLATFQESKQCDGFIWSVGLELKAGSRTHTVILNRDWWDSEYKGMTDGEAYQKGWNDALEALEAE